MKGLLLKDVYTLAKSLRVFLLLIIVFSCLPGLNMTVFAVVYSSLLPVTALSYDERCKWDSLAAMLPYSPAQIVVSKYLLGYITVLGAALIALAAHGVYGLVGKAAADGVLPFLLGGTASGLTVMALSLPPMFKIGVEKGRIFFYVILALIFGGIVGLEALTENGLTDALSRMGTVAGAGAILLVIIINAASILLSVRFYRRREF
ncbi:MAG: ABC-2 transporter permease [Firmicutes bacterium]|nr:ABC-2 transporter permease [Bacillota bacterium]